MAFKRNPEKAEVSSLRKALISCLDIMSKAIRELLNNDLVATSHGVSNIQGGFHTNEAVFEGNNTGSEVNLNDDPSLSNAERPKSDSSGGLWLFCANDHSQNFGYPNRRNRKEIVPRGQNFLDQEYLLYRLCLDFSVFSHP